MAACMMSETPNSNTKPPITEILSLFHILFFQNIFDQEADFGNGSDQDGFHADFKVTIRIRVSIM